jgi:hypothetical protein
MDTQDQDLGGRLAEFDALRHSHTGKTSAELDALLRELNDLASQTHTLLDGDQQASVAKIDELRHQFTAWYNAAVAHERAESVRA